MGAVALEEKLVGLVVRWLVVQALGEKLVGGFLQEGPPEVRREAYRQVVKLAGVFLPEGPQEARREERLGDESRLEVVVRVILEGESQPVASLEGSLADGFQLEAGDLSPLAAASLASLEGGSQLEVEDVFLLEVAGGFRPEVAGGSRREEVGESRREGEGEFRREEEGESRREEEGGSRREEGGSRPVGEDESRQGVEGKIPLVADGLRLLETWSCELLGTSVGQSSKGYLRYGIRSSLGQCYRNSDWR
ncbi:MAG: hypothetical protein Q9186_005590 [Xanthomendoza sp. 1 TL-2023]